MNKYYLALSLTLFIRCKQSPAKQASDPPASSQQPAPPAGPARKAHDYCYSNHRGLFVSNAGASTAMPIERPVTDAKLSPDGTYLAYTDIIDTTLLVSSSTQFLLTGKEDKLIFDCTISTDSTDTNDEGEPPPHLFAYDLDAKKLTRLEPKDHICYNPVLKGDTIFCSGYKTKGRGGLNIYNMDLSGAYFKLVLKDAQNFSCRTR